MMNLVLSTVVPTHPGPLAPRDGRVTHPEFGRIIPIPGCNQ